MIPVTDQRLLAQALRDPQARAFEASMPSPALELRPKKPQRPQPKPGPQGPNGQPINVTMQQPQPNTMQALAALRGGG